MSELVMNKENISNLTDKLTSLKRQAYSYLDQALTNDANSKGNSSTTDYTIILYEKSLDLIEQGLKYFEKNRAQLSGVEDAVKTNTKLLRMREETLERLNVLKTKRMSKQPSINNKTNEKDEEFLDLADDILSAEEFQFVEQPSNQESQEFSKASEILRIENGAQIFYIADDGTVSTPSFPDNLVIYSFDQQNDKNIVAFIKVGTWLYPLVKNESPAMKTNFNAFIFPNDEANQALNSKQTRPECSFIGITFAANISNEQKLFFEDVLTNYGSLIYQNTNEAISTAGKHPLPLNNSLTSSSLSSSNSAEPINKQSKLEETTKSVKELEKDKNEETQSTAEYIASQLVNGAQFLSSGVSTGTEYATKYLQTGSQKIKSSISQNPQPANVDPKVQSLLKNVRYGTHVTVRVSSYLLDKLGSIATTTAKTVAPHIKQGSKAILSKSGLASNEKSSNYVENVCTVASSGVQSFGIVYDSLEKAAKQLGKNFTEQTVNIVDYKYGPNAAKAAQNTLYSAGNIGITINNLNNLKVTRTIAKATAKETLSSSSSNSKISKDGSKQPVQGNSDHKQLQ